MLILIGIDFLLLLFLVPLSSSFIFIRPFIGVGGGGARPGRRGGMRSYNNIQTQIYRHTASGCYHLFVICICIYLVVMMRLTNMSRFHSRFVPCGAIQSGSCCRDVPCFHCYFF